MTSLKKLYSALIVLPAIGFATSTAMAEPCEHAQSDVADTITAIIQAIEPSEFTFELDSLASLMSVSSHPSTANAPESFDLPAPLLEELDAMWEQSFFEFEGRIFSKEQGGLIVQDKDGQLRWEQGGTPQVGHYMPDYGLMSRSEKTFAMIHTHPYAEHQGGWTDAPFSAQDMARLVMNGTMFMGVQMNIEEMTMVKSGDSLFMISTSEELRSDLSEMSDQEKLGLYLDIKASHDAYVLEYARPFTPGEAPSDDDVREHLKYIDLPEAITYAVTRVADDYGFLYYYGKGGTLNRYLSPELEDN